MLVINERCAGLDIGKDEVVGCARTPGPSGSGRSSELEVFPTFTSGLEKLDVLGVSGRSMIEAFIGGERDPEILAEMSKGVLRKKIPMLREALRGRFHNHHAVMLRIVFDHVAHLETAIGNLDTEIDRVMAPFTTARDRLDTITGCRQTSSRVHHRGDRCRHDPVPHPAAACVVGGHCPKNARLHGA